MSQKLINPARWGKNISDADYATLTQGERIARGRALEAGKEWSAEYRSPHQDYADRMQADFDARKRAA